MWKWEFKYQYEGVDSSAGSQLVLLLSSQLIVCYKQLRTTLSIPRMHLLSCVGVLSADDRMLKRCSQREEVTERLKRQWSAKYRCLFTNTRQWHFPEIHVTFLRKQRGITGLKRIFGRDVNKMQVKGR